jgi:branched-subunit amino acid ABC-type transport system permease component
MGVSQSVFSMATVAPVAWSADWAWGLPLIVLTVVIHVFGLGLIGVRVSRVVSRTVERRHPTAAFVGVLGVTTLLATCLHALEAGIWAEAYRLLDALPDAKSAMLYSLNAITSYGHASLRLEGHWELMGAMESLNGWLLFGLTTAFLFGMVEKVWSFEKKADRH